MGCNASKVSPLLENLHSSTSAIEELPVEIIYKILDELDICTIFLSLYVVCHRFHEIVSTYNQYNLNLKGVSRKNFELISTRIRPDQVTKITLSDDDSSPGVVDLFLKTFSIETFINLQSLILIQINNDESMNRILINLADHMLLTNFSSINITNNDENYDDIFVELITSLLAKPSLRKVYLDLSYSRTTSNPLPWIEQSSVREIIIRGTCSVNFVRQTLIHSPYLRIFQTDDFDFDEEIDLNNAQNNHDDDSSNEDLEIDPPEPNEENQLPKQENYASIQSSNQLTSLTLNTCTFSMSKIEWILQELPELKRLRLLTTSAYDDESILDGHRWENLLINLEKFEFVFLVNLSRATLWDIDTCIAKFQTLFWIEDKKWFVSLEKYDDEIICYTLPYQNTYYAVKNEKLSCDYRSTAIDNSLLQINSVNNVQDLYIDTSRRITYQPENFDRPRFLHVKKLYLYEKWSNPRVILSELLSTVDLDTIEELNRDERIPTDRFIELLEYMPNLRTLKTTSRFVNALNAAKFQYKKCLYSLIVDSNNYGDQPFVNIEPFCDMFPHIQHLIIPLDSAENCEYAVDHLYRDLISVIFRIPPDDSLLDDSENDNDEEADEYHLPFDAFTDWIRELPSQYRCHRKQRQIHVCLK